MRRRRNLFSRGGLHNDWISSGRRLLDSGFNSTGIAKHRDLGRAEAAVSPRPSPPDLLFPADDRQAERASGGDGSVGNRDGGTTDGAVRGAGTRHGGAESRESDGVGASDEQHPKPCGGNRAAGAGGGGLM